MLLRKASIMLMTFPDEGAGVAAFDLPAGFFYVRQLHESQPEMGIIIASGRAPNSCPFFPKLSCSWTMSYGLTRRVLRESFDGALDDRLVMPPLGSRHAAGRLFAELQVMRFSEIAQLRLSSRPISQADVSATSRLRERTELLLWLAPRADFVPSFAKFWIGQSCRWQTLCICMPN